MTFCKKILSFLMMRPDVVVDVKEFPSGAALLDVRLNDGRMLVIEYRPHDGYGVSFLASEVADAFSGHEHVFISEEETIEQVRLMLDADLASL